MVPLYEKLILLHRQGIAHVVATLLGTRGEAPSDPGAKALLDSSGLIHGTVGGGKIEARVINEAKALLGDHFKSPVTHTWNLQTDIGMTCGGEVTFLFEPCYPTQWEVVVFGAGHVAQSVVRLLLTLDCRVRCYDARPEWIERLPQDEKLIAEAVAEPASKVAGLSPNTYFVVMTQGHGTDVPILEQIYKAFPEPVYVGAIGSDLKARRLRADVVARGISATTIESLRCPVGLPIGDNSPGEIAVSVVAELLQVRGKR